MTDIHTDVDASSGAIELSDETIRYPTNHVLSILDDADQLAAATNALSASGFLDSEVTVACGRGAADALGANTGRTGLAHLVIRIAQYFGLPNEESEMKARYEDALRHGRFVVLVSAPTDERKKLASKVLAEHGAKYITFLGRFQFEVISP
jgi:hypothetical protein